MKFLLFLLFLPFSLNALCQDTYNVKKAVYTVFNPNTGEWEWGTVQDVQLTIVIDKDKVFVSDKAGSTFITYGEPQLVQKTNATSKGWNAWDRHNEKCTIRLVNITEGKPQVQIVVQYRNIGYSYLIE